jgi:putative MATE family efflux protein
MGQDKKYEIDMLNGPLLGKILKFALPLMASSFLQVLFNAADTVVLGRFAGTRALAAVGSVGSIPGLLVGILMGISIGVNVLTARYIAARSEKQLSDVVHTSFLLCIMFSVLMMVIGFIFARPMLILMGSPEDVINLSEVYLRIYFLGLPALGVYNMGAAVLRSVGDTRRPLYYLSFSGILNLGLNLLFVILFHLDVAGVAWATTLSETVSAILVMRCLAKNNTSYQFSPQKLRMDGKMVRLILSIGLPAAAEGAMFSIGNLVIQSSINSFGSVVMAAAAASSNLDSFVWIAMHAMNQSSTTFVSQNYGAGNIGRVRQSTRDCVILVTLIGGVLGVLVYAFYHPLLSIYTTNQEAIHYGKVIVMLSVMPDFIFGIEDVLCGAIRGLGFSTTTMAISVLGVCGVRVGWVFTVFRMHPTLKGLYFSYPVSWTVTVVALTFCYFYCLRKISSKTEKETVTNMNEASANS